MGKVGKGVENRKIRNWQQRGEELGDETKGCSNETYKEGQVWK